MDYDIEEGSEVGWRRQVATSDDVDDEVEDEVDADIDGDVDDNVDLNINGDVG